MAAATAPDGSAYPVRVTIDRDQEINRLWGIPLFGMALRWVLLVPHFVVVWILGLLCGLSILVTWIPILSTGRFPAWALNLYALTYRWYLRIAAYGLLMAAPYPPFSSAAPYPVDLTVDAALETNRLWGIPFVGIWLRGLLVIPHAIVLFFLTIGVWLALWVVWIPVLVSGRFPGRGYDLFGAYMRLSIRMSIWTLLVPVPYPSIDPTR